MSPSSEYANRTVACSSSRGKPLAGLRRVTVCRPRARRAAIARLTGGPAPGLNPRGAVVVADAMGLSRSDAVACRACRDGVRPSARLPPSASGAREPDGSAPIPAPRTPVRTRRDSSARPACESTSLLMRHVSSPAAGDASSRRAGRREQASLGQQGISDRISIEWISRDGRDRKCDARGKLLRP